MSDDDHDFIGKKNYAIYKDAYNKGFHEGYSQGFDDGYLHNTRPLSIVFIFMFFAMVVMVIIK